MKALFIEDKQVYEIVLPRGVWAVDGEVINVDNTKGLTIELTSINNICRVKESIIKCRYQCDNKTISISDYEDQIYLLNTKPKDGYKEFINLEDEFALRKFIKIWSLVTKVEQVTSEPWDIEVQNITYDTGNPHIVSNYVLGNKTPELYTYEREKSLWTIIRETMNGLGMTFEDKSSYQRTKDKKIWSGDTLRFLTGFGTYWFPKNYPSNNVKGDLPTLIALYETDKKKIVDTINFHYNLTFTSVNLQPKRFIENIETIQRLVNEIHPKQKSWDTYIQTKNKINNLIQTITEEIV